MELAQGRAVAGTGTSGKGWSWMGTAIGAHAPIDSAIPITIGRMTTRRIVSAYAGSGNRGARG
jgi:hypothetical protein